jgi:hypothetical protein
MAHLLHADMLRCRARAPRRLAQEGSTARCALKIVDTILFDGGEPDKWLFTSKVRAT